MSGVVGYFRDVGLAPPDDPKAGGMLIVASTFTATPLAASLGPALAASGVSTRLSFALYEEVSQALLAPKNFCQAGDDFLGTVVLARVEDWLRADDPEADMDVAVDETATIRRVLKERIDCLVEQLAVGASAGPPVWFLCCPSRGSTCRQKRLEVLCGTHSSLLAARVRALGRVEVLEWRDAVGERSGDIDDEARDRLGQIPFTQDFFDELGRFLASRLARTLRGRRAPPTSADGAWLATLARHLRSLEVRVTMRPAAEDSADAVERLTHTIAAFRTTAERHTASRVREALTQPPPIHWVVDVRDRFREHGVAGVVVARAEDGVFRVELLALTCPVLGMEVEYSVLTGLAALARAHGCASLAFAFEETSRNGPASKFLRTVATERPGNRLRYALAIADVDAVMRSVAVAPDAVRVAVLGTAPSPP
jgi:hypothetical protein